MTRMNTYRAFLEEYIDAWNSTDVDRMSAYFADDVTYIDHAIGVDLNRQTVGGFLTAFIGNYPVGFNVTPTSLCENPVAETFAYEWTVSGASESGTKMSIRGISMIRMRGDKIVRNVDYWNRADSPKAQAGAKA